MIEVCLLDLAWGRPTPEGMACSQPPWDWLRLYGLLDNEMNKWLRCPRQWALVFTSYQKWPFIFSLFSVRPVSSSVSEGIGVEEITSLITSWITDHIPMLEQTVRTRGWTSFCALCWLMPRAVYASSPNCGFLWKVRLGERCLLVFVETEARALGSHGQPFHHLSEWPEHSGPMSSHFTIYYGSHVFLSDFFFKTALLNIIDTMWNHYHDQEKKYTQFCQCLSVLHS